MTFHKEGYTSVAVGVLFIGITNVIIKYYIPDVTWFVWLWYAVSLFLFITIVQFFRSPARTLTINERHIVCPADGKVVVIEETEEGEYFKDKRLQMSVFMSPINVHVNRNPISGIVKYFKYHPGKYFVAWNPKSSTENERTTTVVAHKKGFEILYRQIAGAMARRIVWYLKEGDEVEQAEQFGFIKFGSRVDLFLPLGSTINVNLNEMVTGGVTVLATLPNKVEV